MLLIFIFILKNIKFKFVHKFCIIYLLLLKKIQKYYHLSPHTTL